MEVVRADETTVRQDTSNYLTNFTFEGSVYDYDETIKAINIKSSSTKFPYILSKTDACTFTNTVYLEAGTYRLVLDFDNISFGLKRKYNTTSSDWVPFTYTSTVTPYIIVNGTRFNLEYSSSGNSAIVEFTTEGGYCVFNFGIDFEFQITASSYSTYYSAWVEKMTVPEVNLDLYTVSGVTYEEPSIYTPLYDYQFLNTKTDYYVDSVDCGAFASNSLTNVILDYDDVVNLEAGEYKVLLVYDDISYSTLKPDDTMTFLEYSKYINLNYFGIGNKKFYVSDSNTSMLFTVNAVGGYLPFNYQIYDSYYLINPSSVDLSVPVTETTYNTKYYIYSLTGGSGGIPDDTVPDVGGGDTEEPGTETPGGSEDDSESESESEDKQLETSKNIFSAITDFFGGFFDNLINAIVGIFIPKDGFFEDFFGRLNDFFSEKLGFLYVPIDILIDFLNKIMNAQPGAASIPFPEFAWEGQVIIAAQDVPFNFDALPGLQSKIYFVTNVIMIGSVLKLLQNKLKEMFSK